MTKFVEIGLFGLILPWVHHCLEFKAKLPFRITCDSVVNIITSNNCSNHWAIALLNSLQDENLFTLSTVDNLDWVIPIPDGSIEIANLTQNSGYFKFFSKHKQQLLTIFILLLGTVEETTIAIQQSGFARSDRTIYLIAVSNATLDNDIISGFKMTNLIKSEAPAFHATLAFFTAHEESNMIALYCMFCPEQQDHIRLLENDSTSIQQIKLKLDNLNGHGHGRTIYVGWFSGVGFLGECYKYFKSHREGLNTFLQAINMCGSKGFFKFSPMQALLNVTFVFYKNQLPEESLEVQEWFLETMYGEGYTQKIVNSFAFTRGHIHFFTDDEKYENMITCVDIVNLSDFNYFDMFSIISRRVWASIAVMVLCYTFIYKNIAHAVDLLWIFLGLSLTWTGHPRKLLWMYLIWATLFSLAYQSFVSSDSIRIRENYPSFGDFISQGYKLRVEKLNFVDMIFTMLPPITYQKLMEMGDGEKKPVEYMTDMPLNSLVQLRQEGLFPLVKDLATKKLMLMANTQHGLIFKLFGKARVVRFKDHYLCKAIYIGGRFKLSFKPTIRIWSYLSGRFAQLLQKWEEIGWFDKIQRLIAAETFKLASGKDEMAGVEEVEKPKAIPLLWSPLSVSFMALVAFEFLLALIHVCGWYVGNRSPAQRWNQASHRWNVTTIKAVKVQVRPWP